MFEKSQLRLLMKDKRSLISQEENLISAHCIFHNFQKLSLDFETIMLYNSFSTELSTQPFFSLSKRILLPKTIGDDIFAVEIEKDTKFSQSKFGVREPDGEIFKEKIDVCIIPGIAFDQNFNRLGFGKGYYDRFLKDFDGIKIGICFDFQIVESIPTSPHDIKMDIIISDKKTLFGSKGVVT